MVKGDRLKKVRGERNKEKGPRTEVGGKRTKAMKDLYFPGVDVVWYNDLDRTAGGIS